MSQLRITRSVTIPDHVRIARYAKVPELGPKILFFTGGTALRQLSRRLISYTHNSIHLVTPFDSGGSSAVIRNAFNILSVGDLRNRLMALADTSFVGNPSIYRLFAHRLPKNDDNARLLQYLELLAHGEVSLMAEIPNPMRRIIRNHLHYIIDALPSNFDLRGASIGNLILAGGYLNNRRHIDPVVYMFSKLVEVRGVVKAITGRSYHLAAKLANGETIVGQHQLTGKEVPPLTTAIEELYLTNGLQNTEPVEVAIKNKIKHLIRDADLICFPYGSFYTSLIANLLPYGVGQQVARNHCPKVFIPNPMPDPEQVGMSLRDCITRLQSYLMKSGAQAQPTTDLFNILLLDTRNGSYAKPFTLNEIRRQGIEIIDTRLITPRSAPFFDERRVIEVLLSLT